MGSGIAQVASLQGHTVILSDAAPGAVDRAVANIEKSLAREVDKGRLDKTDAASAQERLTPADAAEASFAPCKVVIEAVVERLDVKQRLFRALEGAVSEDTILATNTSSLSIASIASACRFPGRVVGIHFFNPATLMPLVEIVPGVRTDAQVAERATQLVQGWGKTAVQAKDTPGFIVNRIARPYYGEALRIAEEGIASPATIDWAMKTRGGFRMGPFELMDFIGHDVNYVVTETVWKALFYDPRYRPSIMQQRLLEAGLLGKKTGRGFFDYTHTAASSNEAAVQDEALATHVFDRILAMLINEAVDAVHFQIAAPREIDLAMTKGVNYPKGLLAWGDELGWPTILSTLDGLRDEYGEDRYRASVLLRRMARTGSKVFA